MPSSVNDFRIAGALGIDPSPAENAVQEVLTQGLGFPLRPISSVPPLSTNVPEELIAIGSPMQWMGYWTQGLFYAAGSYVRDGLYTAVANTLTQEKPSPIPTGTPEWSQPAFAPTTAQDTSVVSAGQLYSFNSAGNGWINLIRVYIPVTGTGIEHQVRIIDVTNPNQPKTSIISGFVPVTNQWFTVGAIYAPVLDGFKMEILLETLTEVGEQMFDEKWRYAGVGANEPSTGYWSRNASQTQIRVSKTNSSGEDVSATLAAIIASSTMVFTDEQDASLKYTYRVGTSTEEASYYLYDVQFISGSQPLTINNVSECAIRVPTLSDSSYSEEAGVWPAQTPTWAAVEGKKYLNGAPQTGVDGYGYGVDLQFEPAIYSQDWTLVSTYQT